MKRLTCCLLVVLMLCALAGCRPEAVTLTGLRVDTPPARTVYTAGETFDRAGMTVTGLYSDGGEATISAYTVSPATLSVGDTFVTVRYKNFTATVPVTVSTADPDAPAAAVRLLSGPIRTRYVAGETLDPTGALFEVTAADGSTRLTAACTASEPLKAGNTAATVTCKGISVTVPVTVLEGTPFVFSSTYAEEAYAVLVATANATRLDSPFGGTYAVERRIPDPCPDGTVSSRREMIDAVDYHLFYRVDRALLRLDYAYTDLEEELAALYFDSGLLASNAAVKAAEIGGGWVEFAFKFYGGELLDFPDVSDTLPTRPDLYRTAPSGGARTFAAVDMENGVTVYDSEQVAYALCRGVSIAPVAGSPAARAVARAEEILTACCDDAMDPFQKMYNIYAYLVDHVAYDTKGEEWAGNVLDFETEPDMLAARLTSFRAEGGLLYGKCACFGFAKTSAILLGLEGFDIDRVVGRGSRVPGRSAFERDEEGDFIPAFATHSYLYVTVDGKQYLSDATYACAGTVSPREGREVQWNREFAVAVSKEYHSAVYKDLIDRVSSSPDYRPGMWLPYAAPYDGARTALCDDLPSLEVCLSALMPAVEKAQGGVAFTLLVADTVEPDEIWYALGRALPAGTRYLRAFEERSVDGRTYRVVLIAAWR